MISDLSQHGFWRGALAAAAAAILLTGCGAKPDSGVDQAQTEQELQQLREANQELQRLRAENQDLPRLRKDNEELKRLADQAADLPKLRQENQELRAQLQALKQPRGRP